jgi:proteic killer suppression protein
MIKNFKHKGLEQFFYNGSYKSLNYKDLNRISRILDRLDAAVSIHDMNIPGWDLHELKGDRKGFWSVAVRKNWKITFCFENTNAYFVNFEDYH